MVGKRFLKCYLSWSDGWERLALYDWSREKQFAIRQKKEDIEVSQLFCHDQYTLNTVMSVQWPDWIIT